MKHISDRHAVVQPDQLAFFKHDGVEFGSGKFLWFTSLVPQKLGYLLKLEHVKLSFSFFLQAHVDDRDYYGNKRLELAGQVRKILWYGTVVA